MDRVINIGIPHIGEQIFKSINTSELIQFHTVSQTWKDLVENVLYQRFKNNACDVFFETNHAGVTKVFEILLKRSSGGDDVDFIKRDDSSRTYLTGWTAFILACFEDHRDVVKLILDYSSKVSIDLNATTIHGRTAFMVACMWGKIDVVRLVLEHPGPIDIDLNAKNVKGLTAYDLALKYGKTEVVKLLQEYSKLKNIDLS